jgi:hypothetical protein
MLIEITNPDNAAIIATTMREMDVDADAALNLLIEIGLHTILTYPKDFPAKIHNALHDKQLLDKFKAYCKVMQNIFQY